jgi:hypothetical protein
MLTNREIASLILIAALLVFCVVKTDIRKSLLGTIKVFFSYQLVTINLIYLTYAAALVLLAWRLGAWDLRLLKDTVIVLLVVGYPMVFRANSVSDGKVLLRRTVRETLGISALVVFYVNLSSLPIVWEVVIQLVGVFAVMLAVVAKSQGPQSRPVAVFMNGVLIAIGLLLFVTTTINFVANWKTEDFGLILKTLCMTIWLPIALLPLIYVGAFLMQVQVIFVMLPFNNGHKKVRLDVKLALFFGLRGSVRLGAAFIGAWRTRIGKASNYKEARSVMKDFRLEQGIANEVPAGESD